MDFKVTLQKILTEFDQKGVRYALMGGFALGVLGIPRTTVDLDFLVNRDDATHIAQIMQQIGYECAYQSENVAQYISALKIFGEVDFLYAFRSSALAMLNRAVEKELSGKTIKVLRVEDIIGLKLQAAVNNSARFSQDWADIEALADCYKAELDWELIEGYFSLFERQDLFQSLKRKALETK
ncbi:MAG: nucleotidyltransferase [Candidatus Schekmanbacteria bacterium]|nr:nucleotidyltransferase [Candidatus Schekmanbacteria bacterium]